MKLRNIISSSIFQFMSLLFVLLYLLGVLNIHFSDRNDYCVMTYMFEYPQFVRITVPENQIYPQYGLYAYSEGRFTERARKMWFDGVPVLFLPGNSGSHMQVRSLASVALRKALTKGYEYHFDFFTISYNEELSGLYGGVLHSQTDFAAACINKILSLYKSNKYTKSVPTNVILIGHSMGGLIATRLLTYPGTLNSTSIAISLAAPLKAPVINFDVTINDYYKHMDIEWDAYVNRNMEYTQNKLLLSFGNGPRDVLIPSALTGSEKAYLNALTTAVPGVWVSPDHVGIVWCKQLVMAINRYLFDIVNIRTEQITEDRQLLMSKAKQYFQANRSITLSPTINRANVTMLADAFWYEDNRRIYQISRPDIDKTTYLMIRLVHYPQNRFVAIEGVNVDNKDWIFGCNAKFTYSTYRYCKQAMSLSELSRWTGAADDFGKRKLATVHLHHIKEQYPDWSHVIVKVTPTRKPITLNVDINDYASRQILVQLPSSLSLGKTVIKQETEQTSLYYELLLKDFNKVHEAFLLYVEPTANCKAAQYHVSAELHVPWAVNNEYYHYFTHLKHGPMKLRLYESNPNVTGSAATQYAKITLLLDPQCTFTISISTSWYHRLAQLVRNYTPVLPAYISAIVLLAVRNNLMSLKKHGTCVSIHSALMSESVKPYYSLVLGRLGAIVLMSVPFLTFLFENASWKNIELQQFMRSLLVLPAYMTALGFVNVAAAAVLAVMVFSSQLAHRLLFRIIWRGGTGLAEKVATGLQKIPMVVAAAIVCAAPLSCGAASLAAGAAFYAFMLSKMYEEYLEDYVYKIIAKVGVRICRIFQLKKPRRSEDETSLVVKEDAIDKPSTTDLKTNKNTKHDSNEIVVDNQSDDKPDEQKIDNTSKNIVSVSNLSLIEATESNDRDLDKKADSNEGCRNDEQKDKDDSIDDDLNNLNFHMMLFIMWMLVTLVNIPALLTWARNFKYSIALKPDTSYHAGLIMSACSGCIWQINGPRRNLKYYDAVSSLLFTMAIFILVLGPLSLTVVNYGVTFMFLVITVQQLFDQEEEISIELSSTPDDDTNSDRKEREDKNSNKEKPSDKTDTKKETSEQNTSDNNKQSETNSGVPENDCSCNENRIYNVFRNLREKLNFEME